jgi:glutaredoxin
MKTVTLYTKPGCHLCEAVHQTINSVRLTHPFHLVLRNIEDDPSDLQAYQRDIPVIAVDGVEIARHRLDPKRLVAALQPSTSGL